MTGRTEWQPAIPGNGPAGEGRKDTPTEGAA